MADKKDPSTGIVVIKNARASFLALFTPDEQENEDGTIRQSYKGNFLISKDPNDAAAVRNLAEIKRAAREAKIRKWGKDESQWPKLRPDKLCLRDGDLEDWDGYAGHWYLSCNAAVKDKPSVLTNRRDKDRRWIPAKEGESGCPYSGCYVNGIVRIWAQDNKHGKRLNAALESMQFRADGEAFGAAPVDPNDYYDDDDVSDEGEIGDDDTGSDEGLI